MASVSSPADGVACCGDTGMFLVLDTGSLVCCGATIGCGETTCVAESSCAGDALTAADCWTAAEVTGSWLVRGRGSSSRLPRGFVTCVALPDALRWRGLRLLSACTASMRNVSVIRSFCGLFAAFEMMMSRAARM